jgi:hypothetical protein
MESPLQYITYLWSGLLQKLFVIFEIDTHIKRSLTLISIYPAAAE